MSWLRYVARLLTQVHPAAFVNTFGNIMKIIIDVSCYMQLKVGNEIERVRFFHCYKRGVDRVFIDHPLFLEKVHLISLIEIISLFFFFLMLTLFGLSV